MNDMKRIDALLVQGHGVASGKAEDSPFPAGTIEMQMSFFKALGLNLDEYFLGTLNTDISPLTFSVVNPKHTFKNVKWCDTFPAETFSFSECVIEHNGKTYSALVYYPHPETKIGHFKTTSVLELLAPKIDDIKYGDRFHIHVNVDEITLMSQA